jgi:SM-20-related protein
LNHNAFPTSTEAYELIVDELLRQGWSVLPDFVPAELIRQLRNECRDDWRQGEFRHAGIGRGETFEIKPEIRNDRVKWLDPAEATPAQQAYLDCLEQLRLAINRNLQLGLFDYEGHMAVYPPGSFYARHLDQFRGVGLRTVTVILYLNEEDWQASDGGQLRIYTDPGDESVFRDIPPLGGQVVVFLSADFMHEVLPARRDRISITGWFKRREANALP